MVRNDHYWGFNEHLGFSNCCCTTGCENKVKISVILGKGYTIHRVTFWFLNPNKGDGGWWLPISTPESLALSLAMNLREKNFPRAEVGQLLYIFEIMEIMGILLRADVWETRFRLFFFWKCNSLWPQQYDTFCRRSVQIELSQTRFHKFEISSQYIIFTICFQSKYWDGTEYFLKTSISINNQQI